VAYVSGDPIPQRIGDLINKVVDHGDTSGNLWKGGVYAEQKFVYEQVPTTVDYILRGKSWLLRERRKRTQRRAAPRYI
ncbi:MAG: hypothetical protein ACYSQZ_09170, partial [Planctomycetota bacterium]|jgi:hypothetical protein